MSRRWLRRYRLRQWWWRTRRRWQQAWAPEYVRTFLDLSTAHLPEHLCQNLGGYSSIRAWETEYGWFMWAPGDIDDDPDYDDVPDEVRAIWRFARAHGCHYVLLDRDAEILDGLPSWDW